MKYNQLIILLFICLLTAIQSFAVPAEAEYGKYQETWTLHPNGGQEYRSYQELTLFTHTAMNSTYGETFITYNPKYQELKIHDSYVRQKDGTIVLTPGNAFVEVLPQNAKNAAAYNHLKEMVIVHTGLELGATIVLDYSIISRPDCLPAIDVYQPLQKSSPIKEYQLTFNLPADVTAHYATIGIQQQPEKKSSGNKQQLRWVYRNLPAISRAPEISLQNEDIPGILFSTYPSAQQALQILYQQFNSAETLTTLTQELIRNCKNQTEQLQNIHNYVLNQIDDCPLTLAETNYRIRPVNDILRSAYGTKAEKVSLLTALLKTAGIPATAVAAYPLDPSVVPGLKAIEQLFVQARTEGKTYRLSLFSKSPAALNCPYLLNLATAKELPNPQQPAEIHYQATIQWKDNKAEATIQASFSNSHVSYSPNFADELLYIAGDRKIGQNHENTTISGISPVHLSQQQDYLLLSLPQTNKGILRTHNYARYNSKRTTNLLLPNKIIEEYTYTIELPGHLALCSKETRKEIKNKVGSLLITIHPEDQKVTVHCSLHLREKQITPSDYPAFRQLMTEWGNQNNQQLLLKSNS